MYVVIFITVPGKKEGHYIANELIKAKLVACVNIIDNVESVFRWKGKVDKAAESLLIVKTTKKLVNKVIKKTKAIHGYEVPEIIALPIISGNRQYLDWIDDSVR